MHILTRTNALTHVHISLIKYMVMTGGAVIGAGGAVGGVGGAEEE